MKWLKKLLTHMRPKPLLAALAPTTTEPSAYTHEGRLYRSGDLTPAELRLLPLLFMEAHILDDLNCIEYLSGKQYGWLDDLLYYHREEKNVYVSRKAFHLLVRVASGELIDPLRSDLSALRPTVRGWTACSERGFLNSLTQALDNAQGKGRKFMLTSIADAFQLHGLPVDQLPQRLNRQAECSLQSILVLFANEISCYAPLAAAFRDMEIEQSRQLRRNAC